MDWSWADFILGMVAGMALLWIARVVSMTGGERDRSGGEEHWRR